MLTTWEIISVQESAATCCLACLETEATCCRVCQAGESPVHSLDLLAVCLVQTLDRPDALVRLVARFQAARRLVALLSLEVLGALDQAVQGALEALGRVLQAVPVVNLDRVLQADQERLDEWVCREIRLQMEVRCNTRFQF